MKKLLIILFIFPLIVFANEKKQVTLEKCVDGDTAYFKLDNEIIKTRFLAIDTPESTNKIEEYGKEASNYTCNKLSTSTKIEIKYDNNSTKKDKYNRDLVWVYVDDSLLQKELVSNGLAEVKYIYGDYEYVEELKSAEKDAQNNKLNIWSDYSNSKNYTYYILLGIIILLLIFSKTFRKKHFTKIKRKTENKINKEIKKILD